MVVVKLVVVVVGGVFLGREDVIFGQLLYIYIERERREKEGKMVASKEITRDNLTVSGSHI